jgi:hypothetical protein
MVHPLCRVRRLISPLSFVALFSRLRQTEITTPMSISVTDISSFSMTGMTTLCDHNGVRGISQRSVQSRVAVCTPRNRQRKANTHSWKMMTAAIRHIVVTMPLCFQNHLRVPGLMKSWAHTQKRAHLAHSLRCAARLNAPLLHVRYVSLSSQVVHVHCARMRRDLSLQLRQLLYYRRRLAAEQLMVELRCWLNVLSFPSETHMVTSSRLMVLALD